MPNLLTEKKTRYGKLHDSQRAKVYKAEWDAFQPYNVPDLYSQDSIKRYAQMLLEDSDVVSRWGADIQVAFRFWGRRRNRAWYQPSNRLISIPEWGWSTWVVTHELSHALMDQTPLETRTCASHGPEFAGVLLHLVGLGMGSADRANLKAMFDDRGVRYTLGGIPELGRRGRK